MMLELIEDRSENRSLLKVARWGQYLTGVSARWAAPFPTDSPQNVAAQDLAPYPPKPYLVSSILATVSWSEGQKGPIVLPAVFCPFQVPSCSSPTVPLLHVDMWVFLENKWMYKWVFSDSLGWIFSNYVSILEWPWQISIICDSYLRRNKWRASSKLPYGGLLSEASLPRHKNNPSLVTRTL